MENHPKNQSVAPRAKVLLVTEDLEAVRVWIHSLNQAGFDVVVALNRQAALRVWAKEQPNLIVLVDFDEKLENIALCGALRALTDKPLILLSSKNSESFQFEAYRAGADETIPFAVTQRLFQAKLSAWLRHADSTAKPAGDPLPSFSPGYAAAEKPQLQAEEARSTPEEIRPAPEKPRLAVENTPSTPLKNLPGSLPQPEKFQHTNILQPKQEKLLTLRNKINGTGMLSPDPDLVQPPSMMYELGKNQRELEKNQLTQERNQPAQEQIQAAQVTIQTEPEMNQPIAETSLPEPDPAQPLPEKPYSILEEIYPVSVKAHPTSAAYPVRTQPRPTGLKGKQGPFAKLQRRLQKQLNLSQKQCYMLGGFIAVEALMVLVILGMLLTGFFHEQGPARGLPVTSAAIVETAAPLLIGANAAPLSTPNAVQCKPRLLFDTAQYAIQPLVSSVDGSIPATGDTAGVAYQYPGSAVKYVFSLSPAPVNLALGLSLKPGALVTIQEADCSMASYSLGTPQMGAVYQPTPADQAEDGFVLFVDGAPEGLGFVLRGGLLPPDILPTSTPDASGPSIEAEIGLLESMSFAANTKISVRISVHNYGALPFTLQPGDVILEQAGAASIAAEGSDPRLPLVINPGETREIVFTFPRPATSTLLIRILNVEYDLEGY